jgi:hypothetical protein
VYITFKKSWIKNHTNQSASLYNEIGKYK